MRYPLLFPFYLLFVLGLAPAAVGQMWQPAPSILELGVPKPQGPRLPTPANVWEDQQARTRAYNDAQLEEIERYNARQAQNAQTIDEAVRDFARIAAERRGQDEFNARFEARNKPCYESVYQALSGMLEGRRSVSLPLAVFIVENAYTSNQLSYPAFLSELDELAGICWELAGTDSRPVARFMALHRLMTDTVRLRYEGKVVRQHMPYYYDLEDFWGKKDYTKQFVTKLLRTGSGQCHSMPLLYKLLADRLGVKTYISMAPNHSFIQVKDEAGHLYRYETTNGHFVTDSYHMTNGYIKAGALKCGAYLDTLTMRQNLACQVLDLALGYEHYYGYDGFVDKCVALGLKYYPQGMQGRLMAYNAAQARFNRAARLAAPPSLAAALQIPELNALFGQVEQAKHQLAEMGFEDMPQEQYAAWLKSLDTEKQRRESRRTATRFQQVAH